ncbi:MAG: GAF domain-containing protein [Cytophagales bacterium]|nr:GAF domain-containing protein [Cytophagales bacterium]MDW8384687.1 GAF domain-containing protein [Flammeovirgaceae bacterium]
MINNSDSQKETLRLNALLKYEILDTEEEQVFNDLAKITSQICQTPIALVNLLDSSRQWFKAKVGIQIQETPRELSFCTHAIQQDEIFEIEDATQDARFSQNPYVTGEPYVRFYAGMPLKTPQGYNIGTLCVIDTKKRKLSDAQKLALRTLAQQVIFQLELRRNQKELEKEISKNKFLYLDLNSVKQEQLQKIYESINLAKEAMQEQQDILRNFFEKKEPESKNDKDLFYESIKNR